MQFLYMNTFKFCLNVSISPLGGVLLDVKYNLTSLFFTNFTKYFKTFYNIITFTFFIFPLPPPHSTLSLWISLFFSYLLLLYLHIVLLFLLCYFFISFFFLYFPLLLSFFSTIILSFLSTSSCLYLFLCSFLWSSQFFFL